MSRGISILVGYILSLIMLYGITALFHYAGGVSETTAYISALSGIVIALMSLKIADILEDPK